jgi:osmotically-inducible protein OsmY
MDCAAYVLAGVTTALAAASGGCSDSDGSVLPEAETFRATPDDASMRRSVERALASEAPVSLAAKDVAVAVQGGVAILRGCVATDSEKLLIVGLARNVVGIRAVFDDLEVDPTRDRDDVESDRTIANAVFATLESDRSLAPLRGRLAIFVRHGLVTLEGPIRDDRQRTELEDAANGIPGVVAVDDELGER